MNEMIKEKPYYFALAAATCGFFVGRYAVSRMTGAESKESFEDFRDSKVDHTGVHVRGSKV